VDVPLTSSVSASPFSTVVTTGQRSAPSAVCHAQQTSPFVPKSEVRPKSGPRYERKLPKVLTQGELTLILGAVSCQRDRLIVQVGVLLGLRVSEISHLHVEHIDFDAGVAEVVRGKGSKDRYVPIHPMLLLALRRWIGERRIGPVFLSRRRRALCPRWIQIILQRACRQSGIIKHATPHVLRHTFATNYLNRSGNLRETQELLGHERVATTEIYTHVAVERLRGGINKLDWIDPQPELPMPT